MVTTDSLNTQILGISVDIGQPSILLTSSWTFMIIMLVLVIILIIIFRKYKISNYSTKELEIEFSSSPKVTVKATRDDSSLYIANRIQIELITRKAAISVTEEDVIEEIYNSWYKLFQILRDEIKSVSGELIRNHKSTSALIELTVKILNDGLRPHLTKYQAEFRRWYKFEKEKEGNSEKSPQEIQKQYPQYDELFSDMKEVNRILTEFSTQLGKLINDK
ncbi:hypothetical protein [Gracilimonas sediminicola]|uniref:Uncharacterized protein n=1 Tax=Gracilimonas sediminicola TaxID=2952158 RepID=A0A9X2L3W3_9BACT|nr:hypothetical protein [Gracilimonas sediminicola]MCP9291812.1 hypothetical protein [Gracilimonas sediminicola]